LGFQNPRHGRPAVVRVLSLVRGSGVRLPLVGVVAIKPRHPIEMIREIGEKLRGAGNFSVT